MRSVYMLEMAASSSIIRLSLLLNIGMLNMVSNSNTVEDRTYVGSGNREDCKKVLTAQTTINSDKGEGVTLDAFNQAILDVTEKSASVNITQRILVIA